MRSAQVYFPQILLDPARYFSGPAQARKYLYSFILFHFTAQYVTQQSVALRDNCFYGLEQLQFTSQAFLSNKVLFPKLGLLYSNLVYGK